MVVVGCCIVIRIGLLRECWSGDGLIFASNWVCVVGRVGVGIVQVVIIAGRRIRQPILVVEGIIRLIAAYFFIGIEAPIQIVPSFEVIDRVVLKHQTTFHIYVFTHIILRRTGAPDGCLGVRFLIGFSNVSRSCRCWGIQIRVRQRLGRRRIACWLVSVNYFIYFGWFGGLNWILGVIGLLACLVGDVVFKTKARGTSWLWYYHRRKHISTHEPWLCWFELLVLENKAPLHIDGVLSLQTPIPLPEFNFGLLCLGWEDDRFCHLARTKVVSGFGGIGVGTRVVLSLGC